MLRAHPFFSIVVAVVVLVILAGIGSALGNGGGNGSANKPPATVIVISICTGRPTVVRDSLRTAVTFGAAASNGAAKATQNVAARTVMR